MKLTFMLLSFLCLPLQANESNLIKKFLREVKKKSLQVNSYDDDALATELGFQAAQTQFDLKGTLEASYSQQETPPLSPFTPREQESWNFETILSKQWKSGFETSLKYALVDNRTLFDNNTNSPEFAFISPTLELKVTTSIFRDLFGGKFKYIDQKNKAGIKLSRLESKTKQKEVLVQALFDFSSILEDRDITKLEKGLCLENRIQYKKLSTKFKRKSISKREFLQSKKELSVCKATVGNLEKELSEKISEFNATYSFDIEKYLVIKNKNLYLAINHLYGQIDQETQKIDLDKVNVVKVLELEKKLNEYEYEELRAGSKTNLNLEVRVGTVGVDDQFAGAQDSLLQKENPFVYAGLTLDLPFSKSEAKVRFIAQKYKLESIRKQVLLKKREVANRVETLFQTLEKDLYVLKQYRIALNVSQEIYKEAQKDFENGRLDFNDLVEFNKNLINDQRVLSSQRIKIIVRSVELLDYYQFFNEFVTAKEERT